MQKRLLSLLLALCLALAMVPVSAAAAGEGEISTAEDLRGLIDAINDSNVKTISVANPIVIDSDDGDEKIDIDFGGKTVIGTQDGYLFSIVTGKAVTLRNGTLKNENGNGIHSPRADNGYSSGLKMDLTLENIDIATKNWTIVNRTGGTIRLKGCTVTSGDCAIENNGTMTIEGGTFTSNTHTANCSVILCGSDSYKDDIDPGKGKLTNVSAPSLTITGAKITNSNGIGVTSANDGRVTIGSGTEISTKGNALSGSNLAPKEIITIKEGAKLTSSDEAGIYMAAAGTLNVEGGDITGKVGIAVRSGTVNVTGGTITATGTGSIQVGDKTASIAPAGIVVDVDEAYLKGGKTCVTISGNNTLVEAAGSNPAVAVLGVEDSNKKKETLKITGGTFSSNPTEFVDDASACVVTFDLNYTGSPHGDTVVVSNGGKVTKPADPARTDYTFVGWYKDKECTTAWDFDMDTVAGNITLYAKWTKTGTPEPTTYTVTVVGGTVNGKPSEKYAEGDKVTVTPAIPAGCVLMGWTVINTDAKTDADAVVSFTEESGGKISFTMPAGSVEVEADYDKDTESYTLTVNGGTADSSKYAEGAAVTIKADAAPAGKVFDKWTTSDGGTFSDASKPSTTFTMPGNDVTVTATYKDAPATPAQTYTLTVTDGTGGGKYAAGAEVAITANAAPDGKVFDKWTTNNGGSFASDTSASTKFTMPASNVTVTATFKDAQTTTDPINHLYNIYLPNVVGGAVTAPAPSSYAGTYIPLTVYPDRGYELENIFLIDGTGNRIPVSYNGGQYWFLMPSSNVTIYAYFVPAASTVSPAGSAATSRPTVASRPGATAQQDLAINVFVSKAGDIGRVSYSIDFALSANVTGGTGSYSYQFEIKQKGKLTRSTGWTDSNVFTGYISGSGTCVAEITVKDSSGKTTSTTVNLLK